MEPIDRLKEAIDFLKSGDKTLTNEIISTKLRYLTENYVSDILGGSKAISPLFLKRLKVEFSINPEWIAKGVGNMFVNNVGNGTKSPALKPGLKIYTLDDYLAEKDARINDLKEFNDQLIKMISSNVTHISNVQQAIYAMVRTAQEYTAAITSQGDTKKEVEMMNSLSKLNERNYKRDASKDTAILLGNDSAKADGQ